MDEEKSEPVTESPPALSEGGGASTESVEPPFSSVTHLCTVAPDENAQHEIAAFRDMLREKHDLYDEDWATDEQLHRCLVAKQFNKEVALNLATEALKWRKKRAPHLIENTEGWQRAFELESETGKIYSPGIHHPSVLLRQTLTERMGAARAGQMGPTDRRVRQRRCQHHQHRRADVVPRMDAEFCVPRDAEKHR